MDRTEEIHKLQMLLSELEDAAREIEGIRTDLLNAASDIPDTLRGTTDLLLDQLDLVKYGLRQAHGYTIGQLKHDQENE